MANGIAAGIRIHSSVPAACPAQRVRENPLLWTLGSHRKSPLGGGALFAGRFKDVNDCHACTPKKPCLSLLWIITSMGQTAGRNHTRTTSEKKMCLIIDFSFRLFSSTAVTWKPMRHAGGKTQNSDETSFSSIHRSGYQKTISGKIRDPNQFFVARPVETVNLPLRIEL